MKSATMRQLVPSGCPRGTHMSPWDLRGRSRHSRRHCMVIWLGEAQRRWARLRVRQWSSETKKKMPRRKTCAGIPQAVCCRVSRTGHGLRTRRPRHMHRPAPLQRHVKSSEPMPRLWQMAANACFLVHMCMCTAILMSPHTARQRDPTAACHHCSRAQNWMEGGKAPYPGSL